MHLFIGSTNPVKINAVKLAVRKTYPKAITVGIEVESGVGVQPLSDEETQTGAIKRAQSALSLGIASLKTKRKTTEGILGIGLEGGVFIDKQQQMWSTVWAAVVDIQGHVYMANGARVPVPQLIADPIKKGQEMGPIMQQLTGIKDVRKKQGMFGIITQNFVTRTEEYSAIVKIAIGLWYGRNWDVPLKTSTFRSQ